MANPNFYKIDCEREVVVQGRSSVFVTISRNDDAGSPLPVTDDLVIVAYPQANTFETYASISVDPGILASTYAGPGVYPASAVFLPFVGFIDPSGNDLNSVRFERLESGLLVKNWWEVDPAISITNAPLVIIDYIIGQGIVIDTYNSTPFVPNGIPVDIEVGKYAETDGDHWSFNGADASILMNTMNVQTSPFFVPLAAPFDVNPFDGTPAPPPGSYGFNTGFFSRAANFWARISYDSDNTKTNGITFRVDYDGLANSHYKVNFLMTSMPTTSVATSDLIKPDPAAGLPVIPYGEKSRVPQDNFVDYQELHFFGYAEDYVRPHRDNNPLPYPIEKPIYDDRASYGLLKTNPKISGNVKLTIDSTGELWMNSFDANDELADSSYKKFPISSNSSFQKDLWSFFKEGATPTDIVFDLYEFDDQYLNTQRTYDRQYDNFYNYGVEQLRSKFYDEDFTFLAPLWLRKTVPDYFIIFRVDHPFNIDSYYDYSTDKKFKDFFKDARIVKTFDLRASSKAGSYIRKIVEDPRYKERPLEVSWEKDIATYWYGAAYQNGTLTGKGEFLADYYTQDRPIKEFEEYITGGFQRNGIISTNLINLEFLFNDEEAPLYGINRYFGFYVTENQLAEFEIEPKVLGKIANQTPAPKPGVDGQPYSTRPFVQTNPNGIQLPVHYYHSAAYTNNTSNIPDYQGLVLGKFPLPTFVDDPLRFFYVKDRNDVFKRVNKLSEVDYGTPGSTEYIRATQLQLFDNQEDISSYGGVNEIVSQFPAELLNSGKAQLAIHMFDQMGTGVLADDEEIVLEVKRYNEETRTNNYYFEVTNSIPGVSVTMEYFLNQTVDQVSIPFSQPPVGEYVPVTPVTIGNFSEGQTIYIILGGYYKVTFINPNPLIYPPLGPGQMYLLNLGGPKNVPNPTLVNTGSLIGSSLTGEATYNINPVNFYLPIDNYLTLNLDAPTFTGPGYTIGSAWSIDVNYPSIIKTPLTPLAPFDIIDAFYRPDYQQFTWRMIANGLGLQPGMAWKYPVLDPDGLNYISHFSNEGTAVQVAQAIASCINSFDNSPTTAWADSNVIYMQSKILYEDGNDISLTRKMKSTSYYANLGFYELGNVNRQTQLSRITYAPLSNIDIKASIIEEFDQPATVSYWVTVNRISETNAQIFWTIGVDPTNYATLTTTGVGYGPAFYTTESIQIPGVPFTFNIKDLPIGSTSELAFTVSTVSDIRQNFVGGVRRNRNRAKISLTDGQNYYADRRITRLANTTALSTTVTLNTENLYVGASVRGTGIPTGTYIVDVNSTNIILSQPATETNTGVTLNIGELSIANDTIIYQQWYQAQKGLYSRMKGWNVQGKYVYSLPYLDEPLYDRDENLSGFTGLTQSAIIQLEDALQEFFISIDNRIVAYKVYRPILGIFSVFPIKEFDFDFVFSDYSYTPTIETFPYFYDERVDVGGTVEVPLFENFIVELFDATGVPIPQNANADHLVEIEAYNPVNNTWYQIETIEMRYNGLAGNDAKYIMNTFYPLYDYDENEFPFLAVNDTLTPPNYTFRYQFRGVGKRNFTRRYLKTFDNATKQAVIFFPEKFRLRFSPSAISPSPIAQSFRVRNYNYINDRDLSLFNGFAGLQDIEGVEDANRIKALKDEGKFIEAFTYQLLLSEYDRLRENFNKDYAVKSIVVPYINKWVQEGTDARDNYYRLNTSLAFGINNLSPNDQIEFAETAVLTQEFPYLDTVPKNYPQDLLESSRSYMFARLDDAAIGSRTWYDLLTTDDTNDWFTKYFSVGYPTEETFNGTKFPKSREERFTFFEYVNGLGRSQSLFRGCKLQPVVFDPATGQEVPASSLYNGYKFAAIARFIKPRLYQSDKPVDIEFIKNDKYKSILMIITVFLDDYRTQHGHTDYMSQYFMQDLLKNQNQNQLPYLPAAFGSTGYLNLRTFLPYRSWTLSSPRDNGILRPRQGFLGGGYVELGNKKLGGFINFWPGGGNTPTFAGPPTNLFMYFKTVDPTYLFNLQDEQSLIQNGYRIDNTAYPYIYNTTVVPITSESYGEDGFFFNMYNTFQSPGGTLRFRSIIDNQQVTDGILTESANMGTRANTRQWTTSLPVIAPPFFTYSYFTSGMYLTNTGFSITSPQERSTFSVEGGTQGFLSIQNYLTFGNLSGLVNSDSQAIEYYAVVNNVKVPATDYKMRFISPDAVIKTDVLQFTDDTDKPQEYLDVEIIGFNIVDTNQQEYILRHRGFYEPKSRDIVSFWLREDNAFSRHYEKDFLLSNTHINGGSELSGFVRNYGINKVATAKEVLKIARGSSYKSLYPLVGEVAVDRSSRFALDSSWDAKYYRDYVSTTSFSEKAGIVEMKEQKSFLASKAMNVPKTQEFQTFNDTEVTFNLVQPAVEIGVSELVKNKNVRNQSKENADKPKLTIVIDVRKRLLRQLLEDINSGLYTNEFNSLSSYPVAPLNTLTTADIDNLKTSYLEKNIINLYTVSSINLYVLNREGIDLVNLDLTEAQKASAGYKIDKNCVVRQLSEFIFEITKVLDPKVPSGFSISTDVKRI
jgi:hypothetical protein